MTFRHLLLALLTACALVAAARADELVVGANIGNVPWEFADRGGEFVGFEIDLVREAAKRLGHSVEIVNIPFNGLFSAVQSGRIDIALSSMTITDKRLASVAFAQPYYDSAQSLTVIAASRAEGLEDMRDAVIGVDTGSTGDMWTTANRDRYGFADIRRFEGLAPAMLDLQTRRIDGYISDIPALAYYVKDKPQFRVIERIETGERYSMMFARGSRWLEPIDAAISELKEEGFIAALHERWFGNAPAANSSTVRVLDRPQALP
ncbi:MAG: transporter substrate-binding domain-containing protein [Halieaceae bacterium]|jgi:polar amino acid transport system substrate-binding protein|nr:transporter substrate-binding domain-containing protein [Halieaceae bacterium]